MAGGAAPGGLRRVLGPVDATCVVVGAIIGVGIFFTPSRVARVAGSAEIALLAWAVGGLIALCGALTFAELGMRYTNAGGQYEILRDAWGRVVGFLFVFCNATAIQSGAIAIIALICVQNIAVVVQGHAFGSQIEIAIAAALIVMITLANIAGVRWGARLQNLTVAAKLATLAAITCLAIGFSSPVGAAVEVAPASAGAGSSSAAGSVLLLFAAIVPAFFSYGGWQHGLWIGGEIRDAKRNLPRAIIGGVLIVVAAYLLANWAYFQLLGYGGVAQSSALAADAVAKVWPVAGARLAAAAVAVSAFGVLNSQLLSGPRLIFRLAEDGRFLAPLARISPRSGVPMTAILLLGGLGLGVLLFAAAFSDSAIDVVDRLLTGVVFIDAIFFVMTGLALFVLRPRGGGDAVRANLGYPFVPALFVVGELGILCGAYADPATRSAAVIGIGWVVAAAVIYAVFFRGGGRGGGIAGADGESGTSV